MFNGTIRDPNLSQYFIPSGCKAWYSLGMIFKKVDFDHASSDINLAIKILQSLLIRCGWLPLKIFQRTGKLQAIFLSEKKE